MHRLERPLCAALKSHFNRSVQSHSLWILQENTQCQRRRRGRLRSNIWGDSPMCRRQTKRQSCIQVVCVHCGCCRQHSTPPAVAVTAAAVVRFGSDPHTTVTTAWCYSVYPEMATVLLPQGRATSTTTTATRCSNFYYPLQPGLMGPPTAHCLLVFINFPRSLGAKCLFAE